MKIAVLLNAHDYPNLVLDTLESIKTWVSKDVAVMIDAAGWDKFTFIHWNNMIAFEGLFHNFHKSPYRNITFGLKKIYELFPDYDWYVYVEYDCVFASSGFHEDLKNKPSICCLAADARNSTNTLPVLDNILGDKIQEYTTVLGCCVFYSGAFIKKLYDINFYDKLIDCTANFTSGDFPGYKQYAFEETLYPSLVRHFGGKVYELGAWKKNRWTHSKYLLRFRPQILINELTTDASIIHPLKNFRGCSVRNRYCAMRDKYLHWSKTTLPQINADMSDKKLQYLICGTGRCGTVFLANLFNSIGITCGHERIFTNKGCSYKNYGYNSAASERAKLPQIVNPSLPLDAESSYMAAPYVCDEFLMDVRIIHVVRNPIDVINSFVYGLQYFVDMHDTNNLYHQFICQYIPEILEIDHVLLRAAYFYIKWNLMIETVKKHNKYVRICIEHDVSKLVYLLGRNKQDYYNNKKCNAVANNSSLTWDMIPDSSIKNDLMNMYKRYYINA